MNLDLAPKLSVRGLSFHYGKRQALFDNALDVAERRVTAIIGPSGCGKSTHLRVYNRIYELYRDQQASGRVLLDGRDVLAPGTDLLELRRRVSMIFPRPATFPQSVFENVAYGLRMHFRLTRAELAEQVEQALRATALWGEVKDGLTRPGVALSSGQQQRLCIARALAVRPEVLLMDEPTSGVDPVATSEIEELIEELKQKVTIVLATQSMQQAARVSDVTAFFLEGRVIEVGPTRQLFTKPAQRQTEDYLTGRFG